MSPWGTTLLARDQMENFTTYNMTTMNTTVMANPPTNLTILVNDLILQKVQSVRQGNMTLGSFSIVCAAAVVLNILWDARQATEFQVDLRPRLLRAVNSADTFPLVLSSAIVLQQTVFIATQATGLRDIWAFHCTVAAMAVWPAMFGVPYALTVFGAETMVRSFQSPRFKPRGKWDTVVCLGIIALLTVGTWLPTMIYRAHNVCFGNLVWFVYQYAFPTIILLACMFLSWLLMAFVIGIQLFRSVKVDAIERISASRMLWYLLAGTLLYAFVMPFFVQAFMNDFSTDIMSSRLAEVALGIDGIVVAFLHLFMRANAARLVIKPGQAIWAKKRRFRFFGPNDVERAQNISGPLRRSSNGSVEKLVPGLEGSNTFERDIGQRTEKTRFEHERATSGPGSPHRSASPASLFSSPSRATRSPLFRTPSPGRWPLPPGTLPEDRPTTGNTASAPGLGHKRQKSSYSLFPTRVSEIAPRVASSVYTRRDSTRTVEAGLLAPPPIAGRNRHGRADSGASSATVQIGLRLSLAPAAFLGAQPDVLSRALSPPPQLRREMSDQSVSSASLHLPIQSYPSNEPEAHPEGEDGITKCPHIIAQREAVKQAAEEKRKQSGKAWMTSPTAPPMPTLNSAVYLKEARNKVLPPTPAHAASSDFPRPVSPRDVPSIPGFTSVASSTALISPRSVPTPARVAFPIASTTSPSGPNFDKPTKTTIAGIVSPVMPGSARVVEVKRSGSKASTSAAVESRNGHRRSGSSATGGKGWI